jgi:hypothetical protein
VFPPLLCPYAQICCTRLHIIAVKVFAALFCYFAIHYYQFILSLVKPVRVISALFYVTMLTYIQSEDSRTNSMHPYMADERKSKKGEGVADTAKLTGTVDSNRKLR